MLKGIVYKLESPTYDKIYIGSSLSPDSRWRNHLKAYDEWFFKGKGNYVTAFQVLCEGNAEFIVLEHVTCKTKEELKIREGYWQSITPNLVNYNRAGRDSKESQKVWLKRSGYKVSSEKQKEYKKNMSEATKAKVKEAMRKYRAVIVKCDICDAEMRRDSLFFHKRFKHPEDKSKLLKKCDGCGKEMRKDSLYYHKRDHCPARPQ